MSKELNTIVGVSQSEACRKIMEEFFGDELVETAVEPLLAMLWYVVSLKTLKSWI